MPVKNSPLTPFSKPVSTSSNNATISDARFGAAANKRRELVLDLSAESTNVIAFVKEGSVPSKSLINPSPEIKDLGKSRLAKYYFNDWVFQRNEMLYQDNVCINDLCYYATDFWALDSEWTNPHEQEGVLGLANSATTFTSTVLPATIVGNTVFSLSYDPTGVDSIFTLGGVDKRYVSPSDETKWAKALSNVVPEWGVFVKTFIFEGKSYPLQASTLITHDNYDFELPYPTFNAVTNYILYHNPAFSRNGKYQLIGETDCKNLPPVGFVLEGASAGEDITVNITYEEYTTYDEKTGICLVLFRPSPDMKGSFGLSLLTKKVVSFDYEHQRIGFNDREVQHSVQNKLNKLAHE